MSSKVSFAELKDLSSIAGDIPNRSLALTGPLAGADAMKLLLTMPAVGDPESSEGPLIY